MNKIIVLLISIIALCACGPDNSPKYVNTNMDGVDLVEIAINGDTCEFVTYTRGIGDMMRMGMSHWTYCKYCTNRKNEIHQNELHVFTKDCVDVTIYYTGNELSVDRKNDIRIYFHNYLITDINNEEFEDNFYNEFKLTNCKFDYSIK